MADRGTRTNRDIENGDNAESASGGNNKITDASLSNTLSISDFEPSEQKFLRHLREEHPPATPVKNHGNEVLIWMGEYRLTEFTPDYDQNTAEVYMLIPKSFPNCDPHWIITAPALTVGNQDPDTAMEANTFTQDDNNHASKAKLAIDISEKYESGRAWSWRWSHTNLEPSEVTHIARAPMMVDSQLNQTEQR